MNTNKIATLQTYNPNSATSTGGDWTLYGDGRITVVTHSCWQGSITGQRWIFRDAVDPWSIDKDDEDNDAEAKLTSFVHSTELGDYDAMGGEMVRKGWLVR